MRRSFGFATTVAIALSLVSAILTPGIAEATPSDTTVYPIVCGSEIANVYLAYGINSVTITNPSGCGGTNNFYLSQGAGATWTYSKTISGNTTSASYDPATNLLISTIGSADSFTLTLTSVSDGYVIIGSMSRQLTVYFNKQINTLSPDPVGLGQLVTVTGNNLSAITSLTMFGSGMNSFTANTSNRTATQFTFTVPLTVTNHLGTNAVALGDYYFGNNPSKTLTLIAAPVVASLSNEEIARQAALVTSTKREAEKRSARDLIVDKLKNDVKITLENFSQAELNGANAKNLEAIHAEISALPLSARGDISSVVKIARKYEVVGIIGSDRISTITSKTLVEIGLIPTDSKFKATLTAAIKKLPLADRSSYVEIQKAIVQEMATIQARQDRLAKIKALVESRRRG